MKLLVKGYEIEVDYEDYERLAGVRWGVGYYSNNTPYIRHMYRIKEDGKLKVKEIALTKMVLGIEDNKIIVDHIDGNTLNNRKSNLRICTSGENSRNAKKCYNRETYSKYKGVSYRNDKKNLKKRWRAYIRVNNKLIGLGHYIKEEDAARAYDKAAKKYFGEFANLNFKGEIK